MCFLKKALRQTQIIFYRLEDNSLTKIKSYKWLFIYNGYYFCTRSWFSTKLKPVPKDFLISFHGMKVQGCFCQCNSASSATNNRTKAPVFGTFVYVTLLLWHHGWHNCPLLCIFKSHKFYVARNYLNFNLLHKRNWNNKIIAFPFLGDLASL